MILKKNINNLRPVFTVLALLTTMFLWGANTANAQTTRGKVLDFTGSGRTSFVTIQSDPDVGGPITWTIAANPQLPGANNAFIRQFVFGDDTFDYVVPGDYTGTNRTEPTVWRNGSGFFYVAQTPAGTGGITVERAVQWGRAADIPLAVGDYDGDGKSDYTVVRRASGLFTWFIMSSSTGTMRAIPFGGTATGTTVFNDFTFFPGADFNGDGKDELVLASTDSAQSKVTYNIGDAATGAGILTRDFGIYATDISLPPADYTGDGKPDFAAVRENDLSGAPNNGRPAIWYILNVATNTFTSTPFGISDTTFVNNDKPVRGDYDGDGRSDIAVFRESNQTFYWINSGSPNSIGSQKMPTNVIGTALAAYNNF